jgi:hypothetical protein
MSKSGKRGLAVFDRLRYGPRVNSRAALYGE